jgi:hypothetical protein
MASDEKSARGNAAMRIEAQKNTGGKPPKRDEAERVITRDDCLVLPMRV